MHQPHLSWGLQSVQEMVVICGHQEIYQGVNLIQFIQYEIAGGCVFWNVLTQHTGSTQPHTKTFIVPFCQTHLFTE